MSYWRKMQCRMPSRAGFTLIEVLIAAFVISLGVLGLLALFAGAAKQQQGASQITQSVFFSNSAASIVSNGLGRLDFSKAPPPPEGVWTPVHMDDQDYFLTLAQKGGFCDKSPFFILEAAETNLFNTKVPGNFLNQTGFDFFTNGPTAPFGSNVRNLPGRDFVEGSIEIEITITDTNPAASPPTQRFRYRRNPAAKPTDYSIPYADDDGKRFFAFPVNGSPTNAFGQTVNNYVLVDVQPCKVPGADQASVERVVIDDQVFGRVENGQYISNIQFKSGKRKSRDLVSLADRTRFRADDTAPDGRRPEMTYSLLKRQKGPLLQAMIVTYQLVAPSGSARWLPREREDDYKPAVDPKQWTESPLRGIDLELNYDDVLQQYYVERTGNNDADLWAIAPGQILIAHSDPSDASVPSADAPVRIIRQQRVLIGGVPRIRGLLDRGPRHDGISYLSTAKKLTGDPQRVRFIGVNDIVRSLSDGSDWSLSPIDARVIQVVN